MDLVANQRLYLTPHVRIVMSPSEHDNPVTSQTMNISPPTFQQANYISSVEIRGCVVSTSILPNPHTCEGEDLGVAGGALSTRSSPSAQPSPIRRRTSSMNEVWGWE